VDASSDVLPDLPTNKEVPKQLLSITSHGFDFLYKESRLVYIDHGSVSSSSFPSWCKAMWFWNTWGHYDPYWGMGLPRTPVEQDQQLENLFWVLDRTHQGDYDYFQNLFHEAKFLSHSYDFDYSTCDACKGIGLEGWITPEYDVDPEHHTDICNFFDRAFESYSKSRQLSAKI